MEKYFLPKTGNYIATDKKLVSSPAFLGLSGLAIKMYFMLWLEARNVNSAPRKTKSKYYVYNNGEIILTYRQIEIKLERKRGSLSKQTSRAFKELLDRGLIDLTVPSCGKYRVANRYAFSRRWEKYGTPQFEPPKSNRQFAGVAERAKDKSWRDEATGRFLDKKERLERLGKNKK